MGEAVAEYGQGASLSRRVAHIERFSDPSGAELAIVVRGEPTPEKYEFVTAPDLPLQLGKAAYKRGDAVQPHFHLGTPTIDPRVLEFVYIEHGSVELSVFSLGGAPVGKTTLRTGDCALLVQGGHGLAMLEDTRLIELKRGPYKGRDRDKADLAISP